MSDLRVRDLMTPEVYAVGPEAPVAALHGLMIEKRIRHLPVVDDDGTLVGLVSERDLLRVAGLFDDESPLSASGGALMTVRVDEIMTREVETVDADDDLAIAARVMLDNKYGCLPVFEEGVLIGIITEADFVRLAAEIGEDGDAAEEEDEDDEEVEGEAQDEPALDD